ncbi:MAG: hypothetical protein ABR541_03670 [Candidatus Dormibacteria bacterium]
MNGPALQGLRRRPGWMWAAALSVGLLAGTAAVVATRGVVAGRAAPGTPAAVFDRVTTSASDVWSFQGRTVGPQVINSVSGGAHCGSESVTFLFMGWPPGTALPLRTAPHQYVRDPQRVFPSGVAGAPLPALQPHATLPPDATPTGLRHAGVELYVSQGTGEGAIYVVGGGVIERWPRADPGIYCA